MTAYTKFRAWDKHVKKIRKVTEIHFDDSLIYLKANNGKGYYCSFSDIELMQSTGLKDYKDPDRDVFQGDIVEDRVGTKYTVRYSRDFCANCLYLGEEMHMMFYPNIELTVVGNEYENPELLEAPND